MLTIERISTDLINLGGRFDASQVDTAEAVLNEVGESITIDCSGLDYISSAGLGTLIATQQRLAESGGALTLSNLSGHIRDVFRISGLDQLFTIK